MKTLLPLQDRIAKMKNLTARKDAERVLAFAQTVRAEGGTVLVVGGYVRDLLLQTLGRTEEPSDFDLEVYGITFARLQDLAQALGPINVVGESFAVLKLGTIDIAIPRRDSKTGKGHKGFHVEGDPDMSFAEASRRRDFTMNACGYDPISGDVLDEHGGIDDMRRGVLRAVDPQLFGDDPLRALRAARFAARFGLTIDPRTAALCQKMALDELPSERVGEEWKKLLLTSKKPSVGLEAMALLNILAKLHPELEMLRTTRQDPEWHPEGSVWEHVKLVVDEAAAIVRRETLVGDDALVILLGALVHDLGKALTTTIEEKGRILTHGHAEAGVEPARRLLASLHVPELITQKALHIVREHLYPSMHRDATDRAVRRLAHRLFPATIQELVWVAEADHHGRGLAWDGYPAGKELLAKAAALEVKDTRTRPLVMGRDLIAAGYTGGPAMGEVLKRVYEAQLDGKVSTKEEALELAKRLAEQRMAERATAQRGPAS